MSNLYIENSGEIEMLRENDVQYLEDQEDMIKKGIKIKGDKQRNSRIRNKAKKAIRDLTYLAQNLPEKQLKQIFNTQTLLPFLESILNIETERIKIDEAEQKKLGERKKRILKLWGQILQCFGNISYARGLIDPKIVQAISLAEVPDTIKAIYFASVYGA